MTNPRLIDQLRGGHLTPCLVGCLDCEAADELERLERELTDLQFSYAREADELARLRGIVTQFLKVALRANVTDLDGIPASEPAPYFDFQAVHGGVPSDEPPAAHICQSAEFKAGGVVCPACRAAGVQDHICTEECERAMSAAADALAQEAQQMGLYGTSLGDWNKRCEYCGNLLSFGHRTTCPARL